MIPGSDDTPAQRATAPDKVRLEQVGWGSQDSISYYTQHRSRPEDLYRSERYFLPDALAKVESCLDVGCAAGGFSHIVQSINPKVYYVGADVSKGMVLRARGRYPRTPFVLLDGVALPFRAGSFDLVHASGILHLNSAYREIVQSCYAASNRFVIADFRVSPSGRAETGTFEIRFGGGQPASGVLPYIIVDLHEHLDFLRELTPTPGCIRARGYRHPPSDTASVCHSEVVMAVFQIERPDGSSGGTTLDLDLPCT